MDKMNSTQLFDYFDKILLPNDKKRNKGVKEFLRHISKLNEEDEQQKKEMDYILKRTIRGLGSTNHNNKEIYYSLLSSTLSVINNVSLDRILQIMDHELHPSASTVKSEKGDIFCGRLLTYGALIHSKMLQNSNSETEKKILEDLLHCSKQRNYLTYCATSFLNDHVSNMNEEQFQNHVWPILEKEVFKPWNEQTLDSIYLLIFLRQQFPNVVTGKDMMKHLGSKNIFSKENVTEILRILIDIPRPVCTSHPVYEIIAKNLVEKGIATNLWSELDQKFHRPSKTTEYVAVKLVDYFSKLDANLIPEILSPNFLQYIIKSCQLCKNSKKYEATALLRESLIKMVDIVGNTEFDIKLDTIKKLLFYPGDLMIEKKTGIRILQNIYNKLTVDNVKELSDTFRKIIANESQKKVLKCNSVPWMISERIRTAEILTKLLGQPKMVSEHAWRLEQLEFFFKYGFCEQENSGNDIAVHIKNNFYRAIDHKLANLDDLTAILTDLITIINTKVFVEKSWNLKTPLKEDVIESWKKMFKLMKKIKKNLKDKSFVSTFGTTNLQMGLQLFEDPEMAVPSINDLYACYEKVTSKTAETVEENEPQWVEVFVDLLLSLLSRKNHLLRSVVKCVFPHVCPHLTPGAIHHILSVLDVNSKQPLTVVKDDDEEESSEGESESENESDEENKKNGNAVENENEEDNDEDDEDEEEDDEDMEEDNENQVMMNQLKMTLHQALGNAAVLSDVEDMDVDDISDEEGKRLDLSLAAAFKVIRENRKMKSKKQSKEDEMLTHFRSRVIDLLEIYLEHSPSMALVLDMMAPLFMLLEHSIQDRHQQPLQDRVRSCLSKLSTVKKFADTTGVDEQIILDILKVLMEKGERTAAVYHEMGDKLSQCYTFLIRCLQQTSSPSDAVLEFTREKLSVCFKKSELPLMVFKSILKLCWIGNFQLAPVIANAAFDNNLRGFFRNHALEMLECFYQNDRLFSTAEEKAKKHIKKMEKSLYENSLRTLKECSSMENEKELKQNFMAHLFTTLKVVHTRHITDCWNWDEIAQAMEDINTQVTSKLTKVAYRKLLSAIKSPGNLNNSKRAAKRQNENDKEEKRKKKAL